MSKIIRVEFYRTEFGNEPVREWLSAMPLPDKKIIGTDIRTVEMGWPKGLPLVRKLERDLWEVRIKLPGRIVRVFFTILDGSMILLHGIIKKSQKTPKEDLELSRKRKNQVITGRNDAQ
ncbi:MAG: type II toxin-antitoxin system RelE/ParE family toxin [Rectinemataceae bacterium]|nr:type II toxin-antitoxin system RelE/ParE family toxin [Rectinemataceae bacterium]